VWSASDAEKRRELMTANETILESRVTLLSSYKNLHRINLLASVAFICIYLTRSANLPEGLSILPFIVSFLSFLMISRRQII